MNSSQGERNGLIKKLINQEKQAYEGAKMFYYWFIPASVLYIAAAHAYILEQHLRSNETSDQFK
jgi:hypothetical protein